MPALPDPSPPGNVVSHRLRGIKSVATLLPVICEPFYAVMIQRFLNLFVLTLAGLLAAGGALRAKATDTAPDFNQVYELLRANLPNTSDAE